MNESPREAREHFASRLKGWVRFLTLLNLFFFCFSKSRFIKETMCVCVCVFSSHPFWTSSSLDVPAGVTQEEGHTGFLIHLPSAVRALIFVARRIQPFLSLVDREVEFCVLTIESFSTRWAFLFWFLVLSEKNPVCRDRTHVPTCQKVTRCQLSYRGRPAIRNNEQFIKASLFLFYVDPLLD